MNIVSKPIEFSVKDGQAIVSVVVPAGRGGFETVTAVMTADEVSKVRANALKLQKEQNAKLTDAQRTAGGGQVFGADADDVLPLDFASRQAAPADPDAVLEPSFGAKKKEGAPKKKPARSSVKLSIGPATLEPAMKSINAHASQQAAFKKLPAVQAPSLKKPFWKVWGDEIGYTVGSYHCLKMKDGRTVATRIFHCNPAAMVGHAVMVREAQPLSDEAVTAIVGAHIRSALMGRLKAKLDAFQRGFVAARELKARGYDAKVTPAGKVLVAKPKAGAPAPSAKTAGSEVGVTGFRRGDTFVDDAFHEQQMERAANAGPNAMDKFLHDGMMGEAFVGLAALGGEAIEEGVISNLRPYSRGEIVQPSEVMDPPEDELEAATLLDEEGVRPKTTMVKSHVEGGREEIVGESRGAAEEEAFSSGDDDVGNIFKKIGKGIKSVGKGVKAVGKGGISVVRTTGRGAGAIVKTTGRGVLATGRGIGRGVKATGRGIGKGVKATGRAVAVLTKQFVPSRDKKKKALVDKLYRQARNRVAKYSAYRRGSKKPTKTEWNQASLTARKLLGKHGLPMTLMGFTAAGLIEIPREVWELAGDDHGCGRAGCLGTSCGTFVGSDVGEWSLYYINPLSWFRSKEVNALYLAQREAERRKEDAQKYAGLTAETARKWGEVQAVEQAVAADVQKIFAARGGKPQMALMGAWWNPFSWFSSKAKGVMKEADLIAPDVDSLPPLPEGAEGMVAPGEEASETAPDEGMYEGEGEYAEDPYAAEEAAMNEQEAEAEAEAEYAE